MEPSLGVQSAAAAGLGLASYAFYFHQFECHMYPWRYVNIFLLGCVSAFLLLTNVYNVPVGETITLVSTDAASYLAALFGGLLIWRSFLNPLNRFPGPWPARLGNLYLSFQLGKSDAYYKLQALHEKYGKFVRIGSNDLSITDPAIMDAAFSVKSAVTKASWYDNDYPYSSMHTTRDKALHDKRRKMWAPGFSDKALRDYETEIESYNQMFVDKVGEAEGEPVDVRTFFNLYSFDIMAQLAFGKRYGMLESGEKHEALGLLSEGMQPLAYLLPTWCFRTLTAIPGLGAGFHKFVKFCADELTWRIQNADEQDQKGGSDIMSWILRAYEGMKNPEKDTMLQADARLIIVAGSDTTAATFTYLFYHLAQHPEHVKKLREELKPMAQGNWSDKDIKQAKHLNGCINEALRLHPPVPSGLSRLTPKDGLQVGDTYVPGNTVFIMPQYVMGRDESIYPDANSFIPERWYDKPELIKNEKAFAPFSLGNMGCIGKNLALIELRTLTTKLVLKYDMKFAPNEDGSRVKFDTLDHFTVDVGQLDLVFNKL